MKLPHKELARVDRKKIAGYLLNLNHPDGWPKAKFFRGIGFSENNINKLEKALLRIGKTNDVVNIDNSKPEFALKYTIDGTIVSPRTGKQYNIRTAWKIVKGERIPKLITAFPKK